MRILVVEDHESIRHVLRLALELEGHFVTESSGGEEALQHLQEEEFDLILLDINTQEIPASEFVSQMKELTSQQGRLLPRLGILSGCASLEFETRRLGASFAIKKPYTHEDVLHQIERLIPRPGSAATAQTAR